MFRTRACRIRACRIRVLQNPSIQNVDLTNAGFSDTNWVLTNEGNTTASYTVNLLLNDPLPAGFATQLLLHKTFKTPAADGCTLKEQAHTILLANIPNPQFVTDPTNPSLQNPSLQNPSLQNPTLALGPGESATITFRVVDPNIFDGVTYDASGAVTPAAVAQSVNSEDVADGQHGAPGRDAADDHHDDGSADDARARRSTARCSRSRARARWCAR